MNPDNSIHPLTEDHSTDGLTIRQEFARTAMAAMMPLYWSDDGSWTLKDIAVGAIEMADTLIEELNKRQP